jgi:hypothetical protein
MGLFSRRPKAQGAQVSAKDAQSETISYLRGFVKDHPGCEAFIEPPTRVTQTTMVVVAETGEWTRRRIPDQATARKVATQLGVPAFDVNLSGYPSRMREWNETHRKQY